MSVRTTGLALGAALALLLLAAGRAIRLDHVMPMALPVAGADSALVPIEREEFSLTRLMAAVNKDPFHPERRRPARRLHAAGGNEAVAAVADRGLVIQVVGTAVSANGGFAMCAWGGEPPRIVRIGERVGDWTLRAVTPGAAQFTSSNGASVVVKIAKAGEGT